MNLLFSMSLAGSMIFLIYLIIRPAAVRYFPAAWRYGFLKVILLIFLLPYQYLKYTYMMILETLFAGWSQSADATYININPSKAIFFDSEGALHFENQSVIITVLALWGLISLVFLLYNLIMYFLFIRYLWQVTTSSVSTTVAALLHTSTESAEAKIPVYISQCIQLPFTIGLLHPRILLPASLSDQTALQMVAAHEFKHVRNRDNLIKLLSLLTLLLHWYNPLIYLLYWEMCNVSEQVCDHSAIQGRSDQDIEKYQLLLVEMSQKKPRISSFLASPFSARFTIMKERITVMNTTTVSSRRTRIVSLCLAILILALSPISVLAYSAPANLDYMDEHLCPGKGDLCFNDTPPFEPLTNPFTEYGTEYDIFIDTDGNIYILSDTYPQIIINACPHTWTDGNLYSHQKNNTGGCTTYIYTAQTCTRCKSIRNITFDHEITYRKCPH